MTPLVATAMVAPQLAPALFGLQAFGEKLSGLQEEQRTARYNLDNGYELSEAEINAIKYTSLQKLTNAGAVGFLNYVLFGGYIKGLTIVGKIESYSGKTLIELNEAMKLGYGKGFKGFFDEIIHQQKFFAKMNLGNYTIDRLTHTTTTVTGESIMDDIAKGISFAIPFYGSKQYKRKTAQKKAKKILIDNLLDTYTYTNQQRKVLQDIDIILSDLKNPKLSENSRKALETQLVFLTLQAEGHIESNLKEVENIKSEELREQFAIRYEELIQRSETIVELGEESNVGKSLETKWFQDKQQYDADLKNATQGIFKAVEEV